MKVKQIFDAITEVRDEYIEEARTTQLKKSAIAWKKWTMIVAACIVMAIGIRGAYSLPDLLPFGGKAGGSGSGHGESSTFMSYAGPAFPLTLSQPDNTVTATRNIIYDFSLPNEDSIRVWGANVEDRYTLINSSTEEKNIEAVYPFIGSFNDLKELIPTITVNGQKEHPALYAGGYSGGEKLDSWEGYKALLEDGSYQSNAFAADPVLSQPVTVYAFTDFEAPLEYEAATQAISFNIDPDKTTILHYGFNGIDIGDNGFRRYSYFVPKDIRMEKDIKLLIIIGEDIKDYSLQGYKNGACERGNELEGVSSTVTRKEQILSDVMGEVINHFFTNYDDGNSLAVSQEMFLGAVTEFMVHYGLLSDNARDHYQYGVLEDVILETYSLKRVFYLKFQVSVPVGESVLVTVKMRKNPSYDFICSGTDNKGIQGYDMVTRLGSNLHFDALTAELTSTQNIEIVRQNYGFNLSQGVTEVELDLNNEHYYLEIRPVEQ
ncbi:MAG: hypothetical protein GX237_05520 [Clostridiales bacterium]|nr:hypothetical protein [Clostridiales bacterium]